MLLCTLPVPELRDDVVRGARAREDGVTLAQITQDLRLREMTLLQWMRQANVEDGEKPGTTRVESAENQRLKKRIRLLEQENEARAGQRRTSFGRICWERYCPLLSEIAADRIPTAVTCRVLQLFHHLYYRWLANPVTNAEVIKAYRANALFGAHQDDPESGYRFLVDVIRTADKLRSAEPKKIRQIPVVTAVVGSAPLLDTEACRKIWTTDSHAVDKGRTSRRSIRRKRAVPSSS